MGSLDRHQISRITGMPLLEQKIAIEAKIAEVIDQLNTGGKLPLERAATGHLVVPLVDYGLNGTVAGWAIGPHKIRINTELLHTNWDNMLNVIVPHEVAHCVVSQIWGNTTTKGNKVRGHGPQWQYVMNLLGLPAKRCHDMQVTKRRNHPRVYVYGCGGRVCYSHNLTLTRHNKIQNKGAEYTCTKCGGRINKSTYKGEIDD